MTLTTDQITDIAGDLEALRNELRTREWSRTRITAVVSAAAGNLASIAAMRAPVPQQAFYPPPYPYGPEDFGQPAGSVPLQVTVTGGTRQELADHACQAGRQVFGEDASLSVTLAGQIVTAPVPSRDGVTQYQCGAIVRQEDSPAGTVHYSPRTREAD
jgi:hypothetical protein